MNNPVRYVDPDGEFADIAWDAANVAIGLASLAKNVKEGNVGGALLDGAGVVLDGLAAATPFVPGGAGTAIKAGRAADKVADGARAAARELDDDTLKLIWRNLTDSGDAVLGHYPGYIDKAHSRGASYFDIGNAWDSLDDTQRWAANRRFLDATADRGDRILLSTPKSKVRPNTWLAQEIQYLTQERGYVWVNQWALRPGK